MLALTMASMGTHEEVDEELARLGESHGRRGRGIEPHLYDQWLASLLEAVREFDPRWTQEVEDSWREMFTPYITTLKTYS